MVEYIVCGTIAVLAIIGFIVINVAKAKIGWSFVKDKENK